ncbi:asparagine synthase (glutamine-hydrolyzing) [Pseudoxanthomonas broegbernensis]|nr:asparagine synthase (glutamine-hydrolyzing) [Pseudoxanthomonas broegbernensis]
MRFDTLTQALPRMMQALAHRGPDDDGRWSEAEAGIALGHRRLSIVDLSPSGHQPMVSPSGRWVIVFNGEIYNHLQIREILERTGCAPAWHGHSDTETLLAAIESWGVEATLEHSEGMFAFALWDRSQRALWLARDRLGEKPMYYGWNRGVFLFGSELKAIRAFPEFDASVDRQALALYLRHNAVPAPFSIYEGIHKLPPGHWLRIGLRELETAQLPKPTAYWTTSRRAQAGQANPFEGSEQEAADALERLLRDAVGRQMVADVPLGAFLSGGVDSSLVVALMQAQSVRPVRTFSIGFHEVAYNEAQHAAAVARHLGTDHTELYVTPEDAMAVIPRLPKIYDEPFADSSQIPTFLVSQLARRHVTVALSGDGGDELFGGYSRYFLAARIWKWMQAIPAPPRRLASAAITGLSISTWNALYGMASPIIPAGRRWRLPGDKMHKAAGVLAASDDRSFYRELITHWQPETLMPGVQEPPYGSDRGEGPLSFFDRMMLEDACHYLPDDILAKVDRAAMACSLETRVPLLDHRVFEFAWRLPAGLKVRAGAGKYLLKQVLYRHVPPALIDRPKMGFGVPIGDWLRGPLKEWAADLLDESRLRSEGYFAPAPIVRAWNEHQAGSRNWQYHLWDILMFQSWLATVRQDG